MKKVILMSLAALLLMSGCKAEDNSAAEPESSSASNVSSDLSSSGDSASSESVTETASETTSETTSAAASETESAAASATSEPSEEDKHADAPEPVIASRTMPEDYNTDPVEFLTGIAEFNAQVKIESSRTDGAYTKKNLFVDGIPAIEWTKNDDTEKPLVFLLHGGGGRKSEGDLSKFADLGFCAVSIDCAGSGESKDGPIQAPAAFAETVHDIDVLIEYYNIVDYCDAANFGIAGYSMGGNIALCYIPHGKYKPAAIAVTAATPDPILTEGPIWDCFDKGQNWQTSVWTGEQLEGFVTAYKPINFPEYFTDVWVFASNGADDSLAGPPEGNAALKKKVEALGGTKFMHQIYEGYGHDVPESWYSETLPEFAAKLLS